MLKQGLARLESIVGDKVGHLYLDGDTPLEIVKEMLFQFASHVAEIEREALEKQKQEAVQEAVDEVLDG